jgi:hypothetical protein
LLYPKRWHTVIGLTTAGKTTFALWHIKAVLETGDVSPTSTSKKPIPVGS